MNSSLKTALCLLCFTVNITIAQAEGPAVFQFEVKDLDIEVGQWEFQSQNANSWGQPNREFIEVEPGVFEFDENTVIGQRYALELSFGVTEWFRTRFGIEYEEERVDEPASLSERNEFESLKLGELAVEGVFVFIPIEEQGVGWGMLAEYQFVRDRSEADSFVLGPIVEAQFSDWWILLNPALVQFFNGAEKDDKLDFTLAMQIGYELSDNWDIALESYSTIDRLGNTGNPSEEAKQFGDHDLHRAGPIAYFSQELGDDEDRQLLSIGLGLFIGLNSDTPHTTLKWSLEYEF